MMPLILSVSSETRSGLMSSLMTIRGSSSRAAVSVAPRAIFSAFTSTVDPSMPSISIFPLVLTIRTSPPASRG